MLKIKVIFMICFVIMEARSFDEEMNSDEKRAPYFTRANVADKMELRENERHDFYCPIDGRPTPEYTWLKNGFNLNKPWIWKIAHLTYEDEGNYTCQACNELGCLTYNFRVHVRSMKLAFRKKIKSAKVKIGSSHTINCVHNKNQGVTVEWYLHTKEAIKFNGTSSDELNKLRSKFNEQIYTIEKVTQEDEGWYTCRVYDGRDFIVSKGYLQVE